LQAVYISLQEISIDGAGVGRAIKRWFSKRTLNAVDTTKKIYNY